MVTYDIVRQGNFSLCVREQGCLYSGLLRRTFEVLAGIRKTLALCSLVSDIFYSDVDEVAPKIHHMTVPDCSK